MPTSSNRPDEPGDRAGMRTPCRDRLAAVSLLGSVLAAPAGAYLQWGPGVAVLVAAGVLFVVAMLLGWN